MTENAPSLTFQELDSILRIIDSAPRDGEVKITIGDVTLEVATRSGAVPVSGTTPAPPAPAAAVAAAPPTPAVAQAAPAPAAASTQSASAAPAPAPASAHAPAPSIDDAELAGLTVVAAPMTGVFYAKPSPTAEAFVQEGDTVTKGQDLAIIEVMKLMNRIGSPVDGVVRRAAVENESLVEHGSPLFYIEATDGAS